jgi:hypothetical protein
MWREEEVERWGEAPDLEEVREAEAVRERRRRWSRREGRED